MSCACSGSCSCDASIPVGPRGLPGASGPANEITASVTPLPAGDAPTVVVSGVPPIQHLEFGIPAAASPVFDTTVPVVTLPAGDSATAAIDNTDPLAPILSLQIPQGADGADGETPFTALAAAFVQPAAGSTVTVTGADVSWMTLDSWIYIQGGGHYVVASNPLSATQIIVRNPGAADLSPFGWSAPNIPTNTAAAATITSTGFDNQIQPSGPPGVAGQNGDAGPAAQIVVQYTVPVSPPVSDEFNTVLYFNAAPPSIPTIGRFYSWNGASWDGGPNFVAAGGTTTYFGAADPNVTPPAGAKLLDLYIQFVANNAVYWQLTAPSTWSTIGTVSLLGTATVQESHTSPGTITLDAENFSYLIEADKDIDIDFDQTNYDGQGMWTIVIFNVDAAPIDFTAGGLLTSGIPTLPLAIPPNESAVVVIRKYGFSAALPMADFVIEQAYVPL